MPISDVQELTTCMQCLCSLDFMSAYILSTCISLENNFMKSQDAFDSTLKDIT